MPIPVAEILNDFGRTRTPFFCAISFLGDEAILAPLASLDTKILYAFQDQSNAPAFTCKPPRLLSTRPMEKAVYQKAFEAVQDHIRAGNSYMLNLTFPTPIQMEGDLKALFYHAKAPFKCYVEDRFVCFSPERFITIEEDTIHTYPMKGTIDARLEGADERILNDEKEKAEHVMVVDLLRNDLGMVSRGVSVKRFRYVEPFSAGVSSLLQVSSHIEGRLSPSWHEHLGEIITTLLPAGSISGTPKRKSVEIIQAIEGYDRGFFTGIFGIYDGVRFESAVMIRYVEKADAGYCFKSGGGITLLSECDKEYDELCRKVYFPLF